MKTASSKLFSYYIKLVKRLEVRFLKFTVLSFFEQCFVGGTVYSTDVLFSIIPDEKFFWIFTVVAINCFDYFRHIPVDLFYWYRGKKSVTVDLEVFSFKLQRCHNCCAESILFNHWSRFRRVTVHFVFQWLYNNVNNVVILC